MLKTVTAGIGLWLLGSAVGFAQNGSVEIGDNVQIGPNVVIDSPINEVGANHVSGEPNVGGGIVFAAEVVDVNFVPHVVSNYNPVVYHRPAQMRSVSYDRRGNVTTCCDGKTVFASAYNPGRNVVIDDTVSRVNYWTTDSLGRNVHVTGTTWMGADGEWHWNTNERAVTHQRSRGFRGRRWSTTTVDHLSVGGR